MQKLGELAVIYRKCVQCGKLYVPELECDLFCSVACHLEWKDEADKVNRSYGYE